MRGGPHLAAAPRVSGAAEETFPSHINDRRVHFRRVLLLLSYAILTFALNYSRVGFVVHRV